MVEEGWAFGAVETRKATGWVPARVRAFLLSPEWRSAVRVGYVHVSRQAFFLVSGIQFYSKHHFIWSGSSVLPGGSHAKSMAGGLEVVAEQTRQKLESACRLEADECDR